MVTMSDYDRWKQKQQQAGVGAASVVLGSIEEKPDQVAGDLNLASDFGKVTGNPVPPLPMVKEYRNVFQQRIEEQKNKTILSKAPVLTDWLRNPENAAVARDDLEGLSWWETTFKAGGNAVSRGVQRVPQSYEQFMANAATERYQDQSKSFGQILGDEKGERYADPVDLFMAGSRFLTSRLSSVIGGDQKNAAAYYQKQAGEIAKRIGSIPMSPAADSFRQKLGQSTAGAPFMEQLSKFANDVAENPGGALAFLVETAVESAPTLVASTAVTAATRSPVAGATFMGATSAAQEMGTSPVDFFREKGVDVSTPEGALAAISNPQLMADAQERGETRGLVIGVMDGLSGGIAGTSLAASPIGNALLQAITQAVMGAAVRLARSMRPGRT